MLPSRLSFHPQYQYIQTAWDSTSLTRWMECPTKYLYSIVMGYRTKESGLHFKFGEIVHKGLELYHKLRFAGGAHDDAQCFMLKELLTLYSVRKDGEFAGYWITNSTQKNLWNAIRAIIWHTEHYQSVGNEVVSIAGTPAIELPFKYDLGIRFEDTEILYCGHIDKIEKEPTDLIWVVDYKTTKSQVGTQYFSQYLPSTQLPGYGIACKVVLHLPIAGVKVDAIQVGVNFSRFAKGPIMLSPAQEAEWMRDARWHIGTAMNVMKNSKGDPNLVPRNTESCFGCEFRAVCAQPPSIRPMILSGGYEQAFWDPIARKEAQ
jgi:hypothetical protein